MKSQSVKKSNLGKKKKGKKTAKVFVAIVAKSPNEFGDKTIFAQKLRLLSPSKPVLNFFLKTKKQKCFMAVIEQVYGGGFISDCDARFIASILKVNKSELFIHKVITYKYKA